MPRECKCGRSQTGYCQGFHNRSPEEWEETGVAQGAWPVSMHRPDFPQQLQAILQRYEPDQVGLICATGGRSAYVVEILEKNGIFGVLDVSEGMIGNVQAAGWIARGMPIVSTEAAQDHYKAVVETWQE